MPCLDVHTRQKERRLRVLKSRRTSSSSGHTDEAAAQKVLKVCVYSVIAWHKPPPFAINKRLCHKLSF